MSELIQGAIAPEFVLPNGAGENIALSQFKGKKNIVLYFYPKNNTSGCTKESIEFQESLQHFTALDTVVIGISKDSAESHSKFREKHSLEFETLSDISEIAESYGVWIEKSMYGRKYMGINRSTFLIDKSGKIVNIWCKVKVAGHVEAVLKFLSENLAG